MFLQYIFHQNTLFANLLFQYLKILLTLFSCVSDHLSTFANQGLPLDSVRRNYGDANSCIRRKVHITGR